ncbi:MAG: signal peptide peptidase SppA [Pirellulales bacterium]|nr:signal peptide peptidase SppA [Pirellulales bacterium]
MRRLLLLGLMAWVICFGFPAMRAMADDGKPATEQVQKEREKSAADKATLVDKILGVIESEPPTGEPQKPAEPAKPAAEPDKSKTEKPEPKKEAKKEIKKTNLVRFTLSGEYPDEKGGAGLMTELSSLGEETPNLYEILERLDAAAKDKDVVAVWLRFDEFQPGGGNIHEFRAAVERIRKAGKPVYAELLDGADSGVYQVALACDKIYMPEGTEIEILGPRMVRRHYKGLLDKLGMQFDVLRMGRCKGAYEPFTHEKMSPEVRENYQSLIDDRYEQLVETIAAGRHLEAAKVKELIDRGIFTPDAALKAGLVDCVVHAARMEDELKTALKADENLKLVSNYKKRKKEEISSVFDLMKLFAGGEKAKKASGKKKIALVYETGEITTGKSSSGGMLFGKSQGSTTIAKLLRKVADDADVKAVVVRIDGPGGSATASDLIWQETLRLKEKKPVISSMGSVAASGTYYTAVAGTKIIAEPDTLTGSIGVVGGKLVTETLMKKLGITSEFIGRGKLSGIEIDRPFTPEERKVLIDLVEETYREFKSRVAKCRGMSFEKVSQLAEGRVYTARQALKLGLIDEIGTLHDAIAVAKQAAGLKADEEVEIVQYPEEKSIFEILGGSRDEDESLAAIAARFAGVPANTLKNLQIPAFFFRPEISAKPHLYYWSAMPKIE